ncbi:MAG: AAA domain-containing protein [Candidatus Latescibacteria bacterium]|nr:AAA domain-containing protein [Candidatus Latescibacterota bacterium]
MPLHPVPARGTWRTFSAVGGLSSLYGEHIAQDQHGFIWVGTADYGACRFDGDEFRAFTRQDGLCGDAVFHILPARDGRLFFATLDGGVCWYDGHRFHVPQGHASRRTTFLCEDNLGRIWCAGPDTLGFCQGDTYHDMRGRPGAATANCQGIAQDREGRVWFGLTRRLLYFDGERFDSAETRAATDACYQIAVDEEGTLWVGWEEEVWTCPNGERTRIDATIRKLQTDRSGRLWALTMNSAPWLWVNGAPQRWEEAAALPASRYNGVYQDREGLIWFATYGWGPCCYDPQGILTLPAPQTHRISRLVQDKAGTFWTLAPFAAAWTADKANLSHCDGERYHTTQIHAFCLGIDPDGRALAGVAGAVLRLDAGTHTHQAILATDGWIVSALWTGPDGLYLGLAQERDDGTGQMRLARYRDGQLQILWQAERPYSVCIAKIVADGADGLWFTLAFPRQLYPWPQDLEKQEICGRWHPDGTVDLLAPQEDIYSTNIHDLVVDRHGTALAAFPTGVHRFNGQRFESVRMEEDRRIAPMGTLLCDSQDRLWCGTKMGLISYNGETVQILNNQVQHGVSHIHEDQQGRFWLATDLGLQCYTPGTVPPLIRLLRVVADRIHEGAPDAIRTTASHLVFEFKGLSNRTPPRDMHYTWRLDGHDHSWRPPARQRRAEYADLPVGGYRFEVVAIDRDFNASETLSLDVEIQPDATQERLEAYTQVLAGNGATGEFVGSSEALQAVLRQLSEVAPTDMTVLILGETGTGKGLAARTLHALSHRKAQPFIHVNCGAIAEGLAESELFGHEKGAFTGAVRRQLGKVELAQGGTLFLDEVGDMPPAIQVKLLHLLQERTFQRVGSQRSLQADVRVVAATNRDLEAMMQQGAFRQDLYYRLQMYPVELAPLRQRRDDIPLLAAYFVERYAQHLNRPAPQLSDAALEKLAAYSWPGNVRELEHLMQRAVLQCQNGGIEAATIARQLENGHAPDDAPPDIDEILSLADQEKRHIERALVATDGVIEGDQGAAKLLDINPATLRGRMRKYGIKRQS